MEQVMVAYWSSTGNTEEMAKAIGEGIEAAGKQSSVISINQVSMDDIKETEAFALGCPAMGDEVLEESEMEPFVAELEPLVSGKRLLLFGSYGWGDGQWMRDWEERMKAAGAILVGGSGVIANDAPDNDALEELKTRGQELAN